jgi:hypothetical protein
MTLPATTNEWNLRSEILEITHRWPQVFIAFLLGSLLGWGIGLIFPTAHRVQSEIYVAYNADAVYRNPDDFKNWQFTELDAYIVSDDVLGETLKRLREQDPYWQDISTEQLREHLRIYWRNAGRWRLVAEWREQVHATLLAKTWTDVILEKTSQAATHAGEVLLLDSQVRNYARDEVNIRLRIVQLSQLRTAFEAWRNVQDPSQNQPLGSLDRWRLQFMAANVEGLLSIKPGLLEQFPPSEAVASEYFSVVDQTITALGVQLEVDYRQHNEVTARLGELQGKLNEEMKASHNLTASLTVEPFTNGISTAQPVRLTSQMAIIGGVLGVLAWGLAFLGKLFRRAGR